VFMVFGTKGVKEVRATGHFLCPRCCKRREYKRAVPSALLGVWPDGSIGSLGAAALDSGSQFGKA
jgi:hypothetical protein